MIVVVAGQSRKVGKTLAMCDLIAATREAGWVAAKITSHAHAPNPGTNTDTARYLEAGAVEAYLIEGPPPVELPPARNLIIESNAVLEQVRPDLVFFVAGTGEWKESARRAVAWPGVVLVHGRIGPEHIRHVAARLHHAEG